MKKFAVILAGCGRKDGSEINEAITLLLSLEQHHCEYQCFAPNRPQTEVIDHFTEKQVKEERNILTEAARLARSNGRISIHDFCESNGITVPSLKKWMKQYDEGGLEGLARADSEIKEVLPEGVDRTEESYKREILKLRIENERLKKSYAVQTNADGEREYVRLRPKSSK